jgi:hypothetical protein
MIIVKKTVNSKERFYYTYSIEQVKKGFYRLNIQHYYYGTYTIEGVLSKVVLELVMIRDA